MIHQWLAPLDQSKLHCDILDTSEPNSENWFLKSRMFHEWQISPNSLIWLFGESTSSDSNQEHRLTETGGCGKTILCSSIINKIQENCRPAEPERSRDS